MENESIEIVDGRRGGQNLFFQSYKYNRRAVNKNGTVLWRCRWEDCHCSVTTRESVVISKRNEHIHSPNDGLDRADMLGNVMRKRVMEELTTIPKIYEQERGELLTESSPHEIVKELPM